MADDDVEDLEAAIDFLEQLARAEDVLQHVGAFLVPADLVGELAAAPVLGLLDLAAHALDDAVDLRVQIGHLLLGRVGRHDVDELVPSCS